MDNYTTIEEHGDTTTGMVGVPQYTMSDIYRFTPKEQAEYPTLLKRQWHSDCTKARDEVMAWVLRYEFTHDTPLNKVAFENEIAEQLKVLTIQDPGLKTEKFYYNGIIDYPKLGKYMGCLFPYPDKQRTASCIVEKIEFLITHRDKQEDTLPSGITTEQTPLLEDEDSVMLYEQLKTFDIFLSPTTNYDLLYALKDAYHVQGYSWAKNNTQFGMKLQPILGINASTISQGLNRASRNLRKATYKYEYIPLSSLKEENINNPDKDRRKLEYKKWKWYNARVKEVVS